MPSRRTPKLSASAICALYRAGVSQTEVCLRAGIYAAELHAVLRANGVALRSDAETRALASASRRRHMNTLTLRRSAV